MLQKLQNEYEVLTDKGWADFDGIKMIPSRETSSIITASGKSIECTLDHKIKTAHGFLPASSISIDEKILTDEGWDRVVYNQKNIASLSNVYDLLEVKKGNAYWTDGILSHNCEFLGSSGTLIAGWKLKELVFDDEFVYKDNHGLIQYVRPKEDHVYSIIADVSRGKSLDYSAFSVIDVTEMPYQQVCVFRNNTITPVDYAKTLKAIGKVYNEAQVLVEINDLGEQVSTTLFEDLEYENVLFTESNGRAGKRLCAGFSGKGDKGVRTTKTVKSTGCAMLKLLIEQNQLIVRDYDTIKELSTFSKKGNSYEAEKGNHDDLVMGLVLFAWLSDQKYFKELTDINTIMQLRDESEAKLYDDLTPFGLIETGHYSPEEQEVIDLTEHPEDAWMYKDF